MNHAKDSIWRQAAIDILNAALVLIKKESERFEWSRSNTWKKEVWSKEKPLTPRGMTVMKDIFDKCGTLLFWIHMSKNTTDYIATICKKSLPQREYSVVIPGRADSWITIRQMLLWLSKERGRAVQPHGSNCESWCYRYVDSNCNHALLVHKGSMASSIPRGSNLRNTHHTNVNKDKLELNWPPQVLPGVDCRAEEGLPEETAMPVGDHRPHSELGKEEAEDWNKEEGCHW